MSTHFNHQKYPLFKPNEDSEGHFENDSSFLSNEVEPQHPLFSSKGLLNNINSYINLSNSDEQERKGEVKDTTLENISKIVSKTKCPLELLLFIIDFEHDITKFSGDGSSEASKILSISKKLRSVLGEDPTYGQIFMGVLTSAEKVKTLIEKAENKPDEKADSLGSKHDKIIMNKKKADKKEPRTNEELYKWFHKRMINGYYTLNDYISNEIKDS